MPIKIAQIVSELNNSTTNTSSAATNKKLLIQRNRVLDQHARDRRKRQQLEQLERDNFHDDPHANLVMHKKAPKFEDTIANQSNTSNRKSTSAPKSKSLTFYNLVESDLKLNKYVNYSNAVAPAPDSMYVANGDLRRKQFNRWLIQQTDKEPNENELNDLNENEDEDEDEFMDVEEEKNGLKKGNKVDDLRVLENDPNSYKRILVVTRRHFCCVCGLQSPYTCITCGMRYCCSSCLKTHKDTRCLKWTC